MTYNPVTPFRRIPDAAHFQHQQILDTPLPAKGVDKWEVLRELTTARQAFGLSDRDLRVLQTLLSFHPATLLDEPERLVVFPSNASICERLHGMPCSTMRRHLAKLVQSGLILRRDSPNGKRYARRGPAGLRAFGFDLSPLPRRFAEICAAADDARAEAARIAELREAVSLMRRDLIGLLGYAADTLPRATELLALTGQALRRKLTLAQLHEIEDLLLDLLDDLHRRTATAAVKMSSNLAENEQHYQNSCKDLSESEPAGENGAGGNVGLKAEAIALELVLESCPEIQAYSDERVRHWRDFVQLAHIVRPMMGLSEPVWNLAKEKMGAERASIVLAAILQRFSEIRSPGAYLRSLSMKAAAGTFSPKPMILALPRRQAA